MSARPIKLTNAQAETLLELLNGGWHSFGLHEPFRGSGLRDITARRTLKQLVQKGLLVQERGVEGMENGRIFPVYQLSEQARSAALDWELTREWEGVS